jgi:L-iditol 2-dehydrogenase
MDNANVHRLPDSVSQELGAILEPLGVAIHASRRAALKAGHTVLIFGAGAVGLLCAAMCKISGAKTVVIADIQGDRLDFAVENKFADAKIVVPMKRFEAIEDKLNFAKEVAELVKHASGTGEVDAVFECTGVESCLQASIYVSSSAFQLIYFVLTVQVNKTWRTYFVDRNGESYPDLADIGRSPQRS